MKSKKHSDHHHNPFEKSFDDILKELEQEEKVDEEILEAAEDSEYLPVSSALDNEILMHRDVHFGGKFEVMIDYYQKEGKGVNPEFELQNILNLFDFEQQSKEDLASLLLSGPEAEKVARAKESYKQLRDLYEGEERNKYAMLMADLILSEEEEPEAEIAAVAAEKEAMVPLLIDLLRSEEFYDPLYPGYGLAPALAAKCLGRIGDKRAIISLFEAIDQGDFSSEESVLRAIKAIGTPAKEFLLKVVHGKPYNQDNERAALALLQFKEDPSVAKACFDLLKDPKVREDIPLATYLILVCEGLTDPESQQEFLKMAEDPKIVSILRTDMKTIAKEWNLHKFS